MISNIDEFTAVFWDGMQEGIFTIDNFEEWMDEATKLEVMNRE